MSYIISEERGTTATDTSTSLPPVICAPWCEDGDGHPAAKHPADQYCTTGPVRIDLTRHALVHLTGDEWRRDDLRAYLMRERFAAEPHINTARGDFAGAELTLDEAEAFARGILDLVRQARA